MHRPNAPERGPHANSRAVRRRPHTAVRAGDGTYTFELRAHWSSHGSAVRFVAWGNTDMFRSSLVLTGLITALPATMASAQPRSLVPSQSLSTELKPGDRHEYQLEVKARQAFEVNVDQNGIDLVVSVASPTGELLVEADRASEAEGTKGIEKASVRALASGLYRISIVSFVRDDAKPATYTIAVAGMRDLTPAEADSAQSERDILALEGRWGAPSARVISRRSPASCAKTR